MCRLKDFYVNNILINFKAGWSRIVSDIKPVKFKQLLTVIFFLLIR